MATDVIMPQMGESIAEGTITRWLAKVGDKVERDQPLFEISTDKVDAEIPSPADGVLLEISHGEGDTVEVNQVVARIGEAGEAPAAEAAAAQPPVAAEPATAEPEPAPAPDGDGAPEPAADAASEQAPRAGARSAGSALRPRVRRRPSASARSPAPWCARWRPSTTSTSRRSRAAACTAG